MQVSSCVVSLLDVVAFAWINACILCLQVAVRAEKLFVQVLHSQRRIVEFTSSQVFANLMYFLLLLFCCCSVSSGIATLTVVSRFLLCMVNLCLFRCDSVKRNTHSIYEGVVGIHNILFFF